jgi:ElaB/YqjD/DUF883 family membrane-anchored ribosome-binding protein
MDQNLLIILTVFVAVAAIALIIQAGLLLGIYKSSKSITENLQRLMPKIDSLLETSRATVDESRKQIAEISTRTNDILDVTRRQLHRLDEVMEDATSRARTQLDRAEMVLDDTMGRVQDTVAMVHAGVLKPLKEIQGVAAGLRAAFFFLLRGARPNPAHATADEEMFI